VILYDAQAQRFPVTLYPPRRLHWHEGSRQNWNRVYHLPPRLRRCSISHTHDLAKPLAGRTNQSNLQHPSKQGSPLSHKAPHYTFTHYFPMPWFTSWRVRASCLGPSYVAQGSQRPTGILVGICAHAVLARARSDARLRWKLGDRVGLNWYGWACGTVGTLPIAMTLEGFFLLDILIYDLLCVGVRVYGTAPGEVKALRGAFL